MRPVSRPKNSIERALVDGDDTRPGLHAHAGGGGLAAAGAVVVLRGGCILGSFNLKRSGLLRGMRMLGAGKTRAAS